MYEKDTSEARQEGKKRYLLKYRSRYLKNIMRLQLFIQTSLRPLFPHPDHFPLLSKQTAQLLHINSIFREDSQDLQQRTPRCEWEEEDHCSVPCFEKVYTLRCKHSVLPVAEVGSISNQMRFHPHKCVRAFSQGKVGGRSIGSGPRTLPEPS